MSMQTFSFNYLIRKERESGGPEENISAKLIALKAKVRAIICLLGKCAYMCFLFT
jgi:hypothetical protein